MGVNKGLNKHSKDHTQKSTKPPAKTFKRKRYTVTTEEDANPITVSAQVTERVERREGNAATPRASRVRQKHSNPQNNLGVARSEPQGINIKVVSRRGWRDKPYKVKVKSKVNWARKKELEQARWKQYILDSVPTVIENLTTAEKQIAGER